jgi:Mrp family chromosome partitioning ATPase
MEGMRADLESLSSQLEHMTDRVRSIAFCGVDTGVGVSSIALAVAQQLSDLHPGQVIFLDVNSRSQRASLVEAQSAPDSFLEHHTSGGATGIYRDGPLHLLSARGDRRALGRVKAADLAQTLARLKEQYRWVIVDAPPAIHPECLIWATVSDGTILVVESDRTRRQAAQAVVEQLKNLQVNLVGCVLNRRRMVIPDRIYRLLFK